MPMFSKFRIFTLVGALAITGAVASMAWAQSRGVSEHGKVIARTWCANCHLVSSNQTRANADVPSFSSIAQRLPADAEVLAAFIANPHPPMPNLSLSRQDIQDLLAYIATLK